MSHSNRTEKIQLAAMVFVSFGLMALAIPVVCHQFVPKPEVQAFDAPGRSILKLDIAGPHVLYYERFLEDEKSVQEAESQAVSQLKIQITKSNLNRGFPLPLTEARDEYLYHLGQRKGISLYTFQAPEPGDYVLKSYYSSGKGPDLRMSVGQKTLNTSLMRTAMIVLIVVVGAATFFTLILFIVKLTKA